MFWKVDLSLLLALLLQILLMGSVIAERGADAPGLNNGTSQDEKGGFISGAFFYDGFVVCCIHDVDGRGNAMSTGQHCSLVLLPRALSNTTLDACSPGPDMQECSFARCCTGILGSDPGGSDCYSSVKSGSPLQRGAGAEPTAMMLHTVLTTILSGVSIVFFTF